MRLTPATVAQFALDPYPDFHLLREHLPVCPQADGSFVLTRLGIFLEQYAIGVGRHLRAPLRMAAGEGGRRFDNGGARCA